MPATACVEICPTNQVSVRLMTACRLLFAINGSVRRAIACQSTCACPCASIRCAGMPVPGARAVETAFMMGSSPASAPHVAMHEEVIQHAEEQHQTADPHRDPV